MQPAIQKTAELVPVDARILKADLAIPAKAKGLVLFAHGSGSSRLSPRNQVVAAYLNERGIATFLVDLLTVSEDSDPANRFVIPLLAHRLQNIAAWLSAKAGCRHLPLSFFGASTGAAAALLAASTMPQVAAVVSRGGRPDLAMEALPAVKAPTLLIVGGLDELVLQLNRRALAALTCKKQMAVVPGATHLFEEDGAMEEVCRLAAAWFLQYFAQAKTLS